MTNRPLAYIIKNQQPVIVSFDATLQAACRAMIEQRTGSVLVVDRDRKLVGIFTGRDAVRLVASQRPGAAAPLGKSPLAAAMTREPITVAPDARALDALRLMEDGGFRHVPVIEGGRIWGVVSRGDFQGMEIEEADWRRFGSTPHHVGSRILGEIVGGQQVLALAASQTLQQACQAMCERSCGAALVVDASKKLVGVVTGRDAVRALARSKDPSALPLSKAMTRNPVTIGAEKLAIEALRTMCEHDFRHLPVVDGERVLGVVSRRDFTGVELDRLDEERHLMECIR